MHSGFRWKVITMMTTLGTLLALFATPGIAAPMPAAPHTQLPAKPGQPVLPPAPALPDGMIDVGPSLRQKPLPIDYSSLANLSNITKGNQLKDYAVGDHRYFLALDDYLGRYFFTQYTVRVISDTVEVWVQDDLNYKDVEGNNNPLHPDADDPAKVTQERLVGLATRLEEFIRPTDLEFYGPYISRNGSEAVLPALAPPALGITPDYYEGPGQRLIILVSNVRDANFYDPVTNPSFIGGFFSSTLGIYADRNIITIDSKQWDTRVGPPNYDFDATIAHELQHLIHADYDNDEDSWANEGASEYAEFLNGLRPDVESHRTQFSDFPENSLILWGDQDGDPDQTFETLADYQQTYWFFLYLAGRLQQAGIHLPGNQFLDDVSKLTQDPDPAIEAINQLLDDVNAPFNFNQLWLDYRRDVLFGGLSTQTEWGDYITQYQAPSGVPVAPLDIGRLRRNLNFEGYDTPGAPPYGTDYIEIGWSSSINASTRLNFNGDGGLPTNWHVIPASSTGITPTGSVSGNILYSGHTDLEDNILVFQAQVPATGNQTLAFDTLYDIEETWDFGFVQATTNVATARNFRSLPISGTSIISDVDALPIIKANVPGYSGISGGGDTPAWVHVTYDLSAYAGQTILLALRYSSDSGSSGNGTDLAPGWYIDNLQIGGTALYTNQTTVPAGARSIWQARGLRNAFRFDVALFDNRNGNGVGTVPVTLNSSDDGSFNLGSLTSRQGFNEAGEKVVALVSVIPPAAQDDIIGVPTRYGPYTLTGLPPSILTSRNRTLGSSTTSSVRRPTVFPGDNITVTLAVDNFGRNSDLAGRASSAFVAVPLPPQTTIVTGSLQSSISPTNLRYNANLRSIDSSLPAQPGVYWSGTVARTGYITFSLRVAADALIGETISPIAHFANGPFRSRPSQYFTDLEAPVTVIAPIELTTERPTGNLPVGSTAVFTYTLLNTDDTARTVDFGFTPPAGTTLLSITSANGEVETQEETSRRITVPSYLTTSQVTTVRVRLQIDRATTGDALNPQVRVLRAGSQRSIVETPAINRLYLPYTQRP